MSDGAPPRVELAPGLEISRIVTGLWQVADQERGGRTLDPERAADAMERYAAAGLTTFDMADHYGSAEVIAGTLAGRLRGVGSGGAQLAGDEGSASPGVQLLTKWVPEPGPASTRAVADAVDRARRRLRTDAIDLLQFHAWNYADPSWLDCLFMLAEHQAAGRIRHLGLTNCDAVHLDMAVRSGVPIVSNQVCYSLLDRRAASAMTDVCRAHGVGLLAYGTLAGGLLSDRWLGREEPRIDESLTWSQMKYRRFVDQTGGWDRFQGLLRAVRRVADGAGGEGEDGAGRSGGAHGRAGGRTGDARGRAGRRRGEAPGDFGPSIANVACRWVLEQPAVAGIIVGARLGEADHMRDNSALFRCALDADAMHALKVASAKLDPISGDCGDEYRRPPYLTAAGDLSHHMSTMPAPYPATRRGGAARVSTGTPWEALAGYSRAVRRGGSIWVAGTTASHGNRTIGGLDPAAQTHFVLDKIEGALQSLGATLADVVRTRVFIREGVDWEPVARAHGLRFAEIRPANTLVRANTVADDLLVEIEAEAVVE